MTMPRVRTSDSYEIVDIDPCVPGPDWEPQSWFEYCQHEDDYDENWARLAYKAIIYLRRKRKEILTGRRRTG